MVEQLKLHLHLHVLLLLFVFNHKCLCYIITTSATGCPWYTCNSSDNFVIRYPFYEFIPTSSPSLNQSYCGYPQFNLTCSSTNNQTLFSLADKRYVVKDINYTDYTLSLVDADVLDEVLQPHSHVNCLRAKHNTTIYDSLPLTFSPYTLNLTFYFNCTLDDEDDASTLSPAISCLSSSANRSYVFLSGKESSDFFDQNKCQERVDVTVLKDQIKDNDLVGGFGAAMKQGFMLNWGTHKECRSCENNGGTCGYNSTSEEFICYCKNGRISSTHCKRAFNLETKLIIGFGAAGASITMMLILFFFYQRYSRKKFVAPSSNYLSQTISSDYSSVTDIEKVGNYFGLHIFSYAELEEATNNFDSSKEVGDGGFGTVYYGKLKDGREVAIKRLYENNYKRVDQFMNEVEILTRLHHKNLVSLYGCTSRHSHELLLVYEYIPNGTIADHLHGEGANPSLLSWPIRLKIAIETADALAYLHACEIVHRDVKTNNILLDNNFCVKVADFGLSRLFPTDVTHVSTAPQGTPGYLDPDYHHCYQLTHKSDVYSFGVVLIELISSKPAVDITRHRHEINLSNMALNKILSGALHELIDPSFGFETDHTVKKMMTQVAELAVVCLHIEKDMRPSMKDVLDSLINIQSQTDNVVKLDEEQVSADEAALLKNVPIPFSPDSVTQTWVSGSSVTPNVSG